MSDVIPLHGTLDPAAVKSLHGQLVARIGQDVTLDLSGMSELGALTLQLLIAAGRQADRTGNNCRLTQVNDQVLEQLNLLGMTSKMLVEVAQ